MNWDDIVCNGSSKNLNMSAQSLYWQVKKKEKITTPMLIQKSDEDTYLDITGEDIFFHYKTPALTEALDKTIACDKLYVQLKNFGAINVEEKTYIFTLSDSEHELVEFDNGMSQNSSPPPSCCLF